jgi:hypothetical protein
MISDAGILMMSDDLRLNSLERFSKQSPRLVLEVYSHCEVPAGCGGVVLRWRNQQLTLPLLFYTAIDGRTAVYVDGGPCDSARARLSFEEHLLALHLKGLTGTAPAFLFAARIDKSGSTQGAPDEGSTTLTGLLSTGDGTWRATGRRPASHEWLMPGFDDRDWAPLQAVELNPESIPDEMRWRYKELLGWNAAALALPPAPEVWIRKHFRLERAA